MSDKVYNSEQSSGLRSYPGLYNSEQSSGLRSSPKLYKYIAAPIFTALSVFLCYVAIIAFGDNKILAYISIIIAVLSCLLTLIIWIIFIRSCYYDHCKRIPVINL